MARDKNKEELQTNQRDMELRQQTQDFKEEINLPEQRLHGKSKTEGDSES